MSLFLFKKAFLAAGAVLIVSTLVFGRDAISYMRTACASTRQAIKGEVPIEFELQRARDMVANLVPDIRKCMHVIAEEEVGLEHLSRELAQHDSKLSQQKQEILAMRSDLNQEQSTYRYAGRTYTSQDVRRDLAQRFERYKTAEATVASKQQILAAREKSVVAAREKLQGMLSAKRDLEVQIENLDARLRTLQAAQTAHSVQIDDSQLARAKKLIGDLNKQLDVAQRLLDSEGEFTGVIPIDTAADIPEDLSRQIDDYFDSDSDSADSAVADAD